MGERSVITVVTPARPAGAVARRAPLVALLAANAISETGNYLAGVALPWYALQATGSAAQTGAVAFAQGLAVLLAGVLGGPLVDRLGYKRGSVGGDLLAGLAIAAIPLLRLTTGLAFWQLLALVFVSALVDTPGDTARQSLLPDLATVGAVRLERANAAAQAIRRAAILVGPVLAGILIAARGVTAALWVDAASFVVSALITALAVPPIRQRTPGAGRPSYLAALGAGLGFMRRTPLVAALILMFGAANALINPLFIVVLPVYARVAFGSALPLGLIIGAFGAGTLAGAVLFGAVGARLPRRPLLVGALLAVGLPLWPLILLPPAPVTMALLAAMGAALGPVGPLVMTILGERTPEALRARVFGAVGTLLNAGIPVGVLFVGIAVQGIGLRATLGGLAAAYLALCLGVLILPIFHRLSALDADPRADGAGTERRERV